MGRVGTFPHVILRSQNTKMTASMFQITNLLDTREWQP
jgi:hypothetical protein